MWEPAKPRGVSAVQVAASIASIAVPSALKSPKLRGGNRGMTRRGLAEDATVGYSG